MRSDARKRLEEKRAVENDACPGTMTDGRRQIVCTLPAEPRGHQHKGGGWVWWHGNGEWCSPTCTICARVLPPGSDQS